MYALALARLPRLRRHRPGIVNAVAGSQAAAGKEGAALYKRSLYPMVGVLTAGFVANLLIRPVAERRFGGL